MNRESFVFYKSFYEAIKDCDDEIKLKLFIAICEFALYHKEIKINGIAKSLFTLMKPNIEANYIKYMNGCKGGNRKGNINNPNGNNQYTNKEINLDNQEDNQKDNQRINYVNETETEDELMNKMMLTEKDILFRLPLSKTNTYKDISEKDIKYYEELYPNVDINQEFRNMIGWLNSNPKKRKTKKGIDKFINGWLQRKQSTNKPNNKKVTIDDIFGLNIND